MNKTNQVKIGNENFKTWLKKLDPISRVEKMSAIAKTQASAGLRGSLIKASLAQISQRCQVRLIKLTDKQIKRRTRRKPVKRLNNSDKKTINEIGTKPLCCGEVYAVKYNISIPKKSSKNSEKGSLGPSKEISLDEINDNYSSSARQQESPNHSPKSQKSLNKKLKKRFQELFGDDPDDVELHLPVKKVKLNNYASPEDQTCGQNVNNYVSTTVNVNIYNSTKKNPSCVDPSILKKKRPKESTICSLKESSNKRVTIDVSLSNKEAGINQDSVQQLQTVHKKKSKKSEKPYKDKTKKNVKHSDTSRIKSKLSNVKSVVSNLPSSSANTDSPEDDPSLNELWSIFGMKSPTVRSETIRSESNKSISLPSVSGTDVLNKVQLNDSSLQTIDSSIPHNDIDLIKDQLSKDTAVSPDTSTVNEICISQECEPVCKIAQTFSLADMSSKESNLFDLNTTSHSKDIDESASSEALTVSDRSNKPSISATDKEKSQIIETISILDDDDEKDKQSIANKSQEGNCIREKNKVGTIRVKNLGLLMNPQLITDASSASNTASLGSLNKNVTDENVKLQTQISSTQQPHEKSQTRPPQSAVQERFFAVYKCYFNELVEIKIPKLGELLHLAVADAIRRNERIKRAQQLSSDDLINEEKQRAEKDFNDMMKIRGNEFSPLCEFILNRFDQSSKITLFIALLCRIMKHAEQIDPENKNLILDARYVIGTMLAKYNFKDKEVLNSLRSDKAEFEEQVQLVSNLVEKCLNNSTPERSNSLNVEHMSSMSSAVINRPSNTINKVKPDSTDKDLTSTVYINATQMMNNVIESCLIDKDLERNNVSGLPSVIKNRLLTSSQVTQSSNINTSSSSTNRVNALQLMNNITEKCLGDNLERSSLSDLPDVVNNRPMPSNKLSEVTQTGHLDTSRVNSAQLMNNVTENYLIDNDLERSSVNAEPDVAKNGPLPLSQVTKTGNITKRNLIDSTQMMNNVTERCITTNNQKRNDTKILPKVPKYMVKSKSSFPVAQSGVVQLASKNFQTSVTQNSIDQRENVTFSLPPASNNSTNDNSVLKANALQLSQPPLSIALVSMAKPTYLTVQSNGVPSVSRQQAKSYPIVFRNMNDTITLTPIGVHSTHPVNQTHLNLNPQTSATSLPSRPVVITPVSTSIPNNLNSTSLQNTQIRETTIASQDQSHQMKNIPNMDSMRNQHPLLFPELAPPVFKRIDASAVSVSSTNTEKSLGQSSLAQLLQMPVNIERNKSDVNSRSFSVIEENNQNSNGKLKIHNILKEYRAVVGSSRSAESNPTPITFFEQTQIGETQGKQPRVINILKKNSGYMVNTKTTTPSSTTGSAEASNAILSQTNNSLSQSNVPSSSHCHPFVRRMPISGKMKMFFGGSSTNN